MNDIFLEKYTGCKYHCITSFGRTALYLLIKTLKLEGKEILIPAFICNSVIDAILKAGARPVFVDVNILDLSLNLNDARQKITSASAAILFVHYFGFVYPDINNLKEFTQKNHLFLIEDCSQSLGAWHQGKRVGSIGDASIFSFTKNTLAFGGGAIGTNNETLFKQIKVEISNEYKINNKLWRRFYKFIVTSVYYYKLCVDKMIYDRPNRSIFKWWLINIPDYCLKPLVFFKNLFVSTKNNSENNSSLALSKDSFLDMNIIPLSLTIYSIRKQLRKLDENNKSRMAIIQILKRKILYLYYNINSKSEDINVGTFLPLQIQNRDIGKLISQLKKQGLLLRETWPAFQTCMINHTTENISFLASTLLLLEINPYLTEQEINKIAFLLLKI